MKYKIFIPHTRNIDILKKCLSNLQDFYKDIILVNNSGSDIDIDKNITILDTPVELYTAQTYNFIMNYSLRNNLDCIFFMHDDCLVPDSNDMSDFIRLSLEALEKNSSIGWLYVDNKKENCPKDLLCCYRCDMLKEIGGWDALRYPFYYLDLDFKLKVDQSSWDINSIEKNIIHENDGSNTIKSSAERSIINCYYLEVSRILFETEWENSE